MLESGWPNGFVKEIAHSVAQFIFLLKFNIKNSFFVKMEVKK
jgi:hypothetical protein